MLPSILYSCEAWGPIDNIKEKVQQIERKALKRCLGVKKGTSDDIIYQEINRPDIMATIKDRQHRFFIKIMNLHPKEAIVKSIWERYCTLEYSKNLMNLISYYTNLKNDNAINNKSERQERIKSSERTMCRTYRTLTKLEDTKVLYNRMINDSNRKIITR